MTSSASAQNCMPDSTCSIFQDLNACIEILPKGKALSAIHTTQCNDLDPLHRVHSEQATLRGDSTKSGVAQALSIERYYDLPNVLGP